MSTCLYDPSLRGPRRFGRRLCLFAFVVDPFVVWHFYYVIFNPDVYPMNFTWITGKMSEKDMEHEHPLELERRKAEEGKEQAEEGR